MRLPRDLAHVPPVQGSAEPDVSEHHIEAVALLENRGGDLPVAGFHDGAIGSFEELDDRLADEPFILDDENGKAPVALRSARARLSGV